MARRPLSLDAVSLLVEILEQSEPFLTAAAAIDEPEAPRLIEAGILVPSGYETIVSDRDAGGEGPVNVTPMDDSGLGWFSRSEGWRSVDPKRLVRYVANVPVALEVLGGLVRTGPIRPLTTALWDAGSVRLQSRRRRIPLMFARRLGDPLTWAPVREELRVRSTGDLSILVTSTSRNRLPNGLPLGFKLFPLEDVVGDDGILDGQRLGTLVEDSPTPVASQQLVVHANGRLVDLRGERFTFKGEIQRQIIRYLHQRFQAGETSVSTAALMEELDLPGRRLRDQFKNHPALKTLLFEKSGYCGFRL